MLRVAVYARFSSDRQKETSAEDQVRDCRAFTDRKGWSVVDVYTDLAITGANNRRPGMTQMLTDAAAGLFDIVLAEDLDRIARDQEDSAAIYKRLRFADVQLVTLDKGGPVDELDIGLKGTMGALFLKNLADKVRRGQRGTLARGRVPGGKCYGYDIVRELGPDGRVEAGRRRINPEQAAIVVRIMTEFVAGRSPKKIALDLNGEGVPSPRGGEWRASAIVGNRARGVGLLHNPIYVGRYVYNRVTMRRDPETRNRVSKTTPAAERIEVDMPELRIVTDELWQAVQEARSVRSVLPLVGRKRPKHVFSGLSRCGVCGGAYAIISRDRMGCTRARDAGTCGNRAIVGLGELQERVLAGLEGRLLSPDAVSLVVRTYHLERERQSRESGRARAATERRLRQAEAAVERLVAAIANGAADFADIRQELGRKTAERDEARAELAEHEALPVIALHPQIAEAYRARVTRLTAQLASGEPISDGVRESIRALVDAIEITPAETGGVAIELIGSFEAAMALANEKAAPQRGAARTVMLVAGTGFEPVTFRL